MHGPAATGLAQAPAAVPVADGRRLKLGVLTFHRSINYGSWWQARCLVTGLRELGHDAVLLDHRSRAIDRAEWRCALQPMLPVRSPREDRRRHAEKVRAFARSLAHLPRSAPFDADHPALLCGYDAVIVGSDEVWNPSHPWHGGSSLFWGRGLAGPRLIAHAASCGNHASGLDEGQAGALARFAAIAVRDRTTASLVEQATGRTPPLVLDPVLHFPPAPHPPLRRAPYALVYGHEFPEWLGPAARDWARARGLALLSVGYRAPFADEHWLEASPAGFACAVAGASAVITSMFHGCVFALNAKLPFVAVPSPYRVAKLADLVALVGAGRHLLDSPAPLAPLLDVPLAPTIEGAIAALRLRSQATLRAALA